MSRTAVWAVAVCVAFAGGEAVAATLQPSESTADRLELQRGSESNIVYFLPGGPVTVRYLKPPAERRIPKMISAPVLPVEAETPCPDLVVC